MADKLIKTRFAPSPTGFMHIGNLRTALYSYLLAKSQEGKFILRIEDTDRKRYNETALHEMTGIDYDEGPVVGGENGPYIQSQRLEIYREYAQKLVDSGHAYYCFCTPERLESLKDDKGINADDLYKEAERLAQELKDGQNRQEEDPEAFAAAQPDKQENPKKEETRPYSGPSVLSWSLDGRNASHLPIPAYRCYGAGEVTVIITVNNRGDVVNAKVDDKLSASDGCLRTFAVRAARLSKFSASASAPSRQMGTITYAFIAQ